MLTDRNSHAKEAILRFAPPLSLPTLCVPLAFACTFGRF
jgi:hypothetical protein